MNKRIFLLFIFNISVFTCKDICWLCATSFSTSSIIKNSNLKKMIDKNSKKEYISEKDRESNFYKLNEEIEKNDEKRGDSFLSNILTQYQEKNIQLQIIFYYLLFNGQEKYFINEYYCTSCSGTSYSIKDHIKHMALLNMVKEYLEILSSLESDDRYVVKKGLLDFYLQQFIALKLEIFHFTDYNPYEIINYINDEIKTKNIQKHIEEIDIKIEYIYDIYVKNYIKHSYLMGMLLTMLCTLCVVTLLVFFICYSRQEINITFLILSISMLIISILVGVCFYKITKNKSNIEILINKKIDVERPQKSKQEKEEYLIEENTNNQWTYHYSKNYLSSLWEYYFCPCSKKQQQYVPSIINISYFHEKRIRNNMYENAHDNTTISYLMQAEYEDFVKHRKDQNATNQIYQQCVSFILNKEIAQKSTHHSSKYYNSNIKIPIYLPEHHYNFVLGLYLYKYFVDLEKQPQNHENFLSYINRIFEGLKHTYNINTMDKDTKIDVLRSIYMAMHNHQKKDKIFMYAVIFAIFILLITCGFVEFIFFHNINFIGIIIIIIVMSFMLILSFLFTYVMCKIFSKLNHTIKEMEKEINNIYFSISTEKSSSKDNSFEIEKMV